MQSQIKGYLNDPYRVFYNIGVPAQEVAPHYHDFRKIVILLDGEIGYMVEDRRYELRAGSVVFVDAGQIHRPLLNKNSIYERIIIYLSDEFMHSRQGLMAGFEIARQRDTCAFAAEELMMLVSAQASLLTDKACAGSSAPLALQESRLTQFLIMAGDIIRGSDNGPGAPASVSPMVRDVIDYIEDNLTEEMTIDAIAGHVHLSRGYLMHAFRDETGYTVGDYITDKRLFLARRLLERGGAAMDAAVSAGFSTYSSFYRCYKAKYGVNPRETVRSKNIGAKIIE